MSHADSISDLLARASELSKRGDSDSAGKYLQTAFDVEPDNLEVLRYAVHFYGSSDPKKARTYAQRAKEVAMNIALEMDEVLGTSSGGEHKKRPASRHIGGIIGPY